MGLPMLAVVWPQSWFLLGFVILLEGYVARRVLGVTFKEAFKGMAIANGFSTLVGVPVTWAVLVVGQMIVGGGGFRGLGTPAQKLYAVTVQAPWLLPYQDHFSWMVPAATAVLCVPFFFMSVWTEFQVARKYFSPDHPGDVLRAAWLANAVSYGLIVLFLVVRLVIVLT